MRGRRSKDNCYLWVSQEESFISTCLLSKEEEIKLWHQRLGHLHLKGIKKALSSEAIRGLPDLKIVEAACVVNVKLANKQGFPIQGWNIKQPLKFLNFCTWI